MFVECAQIVNAMEPIVVDQLLEEVVLQVQPLYLTEI